ncbi:hypothetical protein BN1708_000666 [Verticillium longisporum]|uniref:RING-type domain-containing protein n=1 Tax=Verticillium longisporum TaxID=100787 RepID=A0A0G4LXR0_VERLO|nr:hypothetical protein BN1708_000666 [Verticillium longisporum]
MSSAPSITGKSLSASTSHSAAVQPGPAPSSFESTRRPNQTSPSIIQTNARKAQAARKQHKNQRRPAGFGQPRQNSTLDDDDDMAEIRAVRNASSRRGQTSITHLLNYSTPSRHYQDHLHTYHHSSHSRSYRRNPTWGPGSGHHAADKARYVHANYRFVVSPEGSYATQAVDADEHLQWGDVLQILASAESQATSCPICLSEPVAPRMAKCGHIFCLPCLIRFMSASDDDAKNNRGARWKKCPICEDSVYLHETRPVRFYAGQESPLPRGTAGYMSEQYDEEIHALQKQETEDQLLYHEDDEWTQKAIRAIITARDKIKVLGDQAALPAASSKDAGQTRVVQPDFFFYASQPHLYLSALDIRILKTKYGDFSAFPSTLLPRVEHISTGHVLDDAQRKRAKYLGHLPYGCVISFLECDWTDIVPAEILDKFAGDIEKRRKRNRDKAAQEDRERLQAERLEAAAMRSSTGTRRQYDPIDEDNVPSLNSADFQPLNSAAAHHAGTTPPEPRQGFGQLADLSTSPSAVRTVWGTPAISGTSPEFGPIDGAGVGTDDGWLKDDDFLGAAELHFQMEAFGLEPGPSGVPESSGGPSKAGASAGGGGGKGKKKKQKITLMSTGGRRGN